MSLWTTRKDWLPPLATTNSSVRETARQTNRSVCRCARRRVSTSSNPSSLQHFSSLLGLHVESVIYASCKKAQCLELRISREIRAL